MKIKTFLIIFALIILVGCSQGTPEIISTGSPEKGTVKGQLSIENHTELVGLVLYLGDVITDSNGLNGGFLNVETAPLAKFDETSGDFVFSNVVPGEYSLIIKEVVFGGKLLTDESGNARVIEVSAGSITDLGIVDFEGF